MLPKTLLAQCLSYSAEPIGRGFEFILELIFNTFLLTVSLPFPEGCKAELAQMADYITETVYLPTDGHQSKY